ncbi:MAG: hypothetical protein FWH02_04095 [Oscillospiraceae bacterium]|nr:hypothetical protein [Oscillospiraceae bacterium]
MSEKPRLKETDEILNSVRKKGMDPKGDAPVARPAEPAPARDEAPDITDDEMSPTEEGASEMRLKGTDEILESVSRRGRSVKRASPPAFTPPEISAPVTETAQPDATADDRPRRRRGRPQKRETDSPPDRQDDRRPLDFGKYNLNDAIRDVKEEMGEQPEPEIPEPPAARTSARGRRRASAPYRKAELAMETAVEPPPEETPPEPPQPVPYEFPRVSRDELNTQQAEPDIREYSFEEFGEPSPPARTEPPPVLPKPETDEEKRTRISRDENSRENFREELARTFEAQFAQRFLKRESGADSPANGQAAAPGAASGRDRGTRPFFDNFVTENEDPADSTGGAIEPEAQDFLDQFTEEINREEETVTEEFKDTLAKKFMRERERYLNELGIAAARDEQQQEEEIPEPEPEPRARRILDVQIQPEMHTDEDIDTGSPAPPVTYNRMGFARKEATEHDDGGPVFNPAPNRTQRPSLGRGQAAENTGRGQAAENTGRAPSGKKNAEDLLMELAAQTKAAEDRLFGTGRGRAKPARKRQNTRILTAAFTGKTEEKPKRGKRKDKTADEKPETAGGMYRVVIPVLLAGLLVFGGSFWWFFSGNTIGLPMAPNRGADDSSYDGNLGEIPSGDNTLTLYESRHFEASGPGRYRDAVVRRSDIDISNLYVENILLISDAETTGRVTLTGVSADRAIHITSCAVNELELVDVRTPRVVLANSQVPVTLRVGGNSDIGTVEMEAGAAISQGVLHEDALGIQNIAISAKSSGGISATLSSLTVPSLSTEGETVLRFENSRVGNMSAEGAISIDGSGRISNLTLTEDTHRNVSAVSLDLSAAITPMSISGAVNAARTLQAVIRGVDISNLHVRSPADIQISGDINTLATADSIGISGSGTIGSFTVNRRFGNARLPIDISGVTVFSMIGEAETRINITGSGRVNDLTCNASTYALGNKIGMLRVNNDRVIYENEPDNIIIAQGIRPPETAADNPNIDFNLSTAQSAPPPDTSIDNVSTTCGHTREAGGFLRGDGSRSDPFEVETPAQLAHISAHLDSYFIQTADIDIAGDASFVSGFPIIGSGDSPFTGEYDGSGYSIRGIRIQSDQNRVGLFAANAGVIRGITLMPGEIGALSSGTVYIGGIAGVNLESGQILSSSNRARVSGRDSAYVGGIAGYNYGGLIRDCYNAAQIRGVSNVGGIAGMSLGAGVIAGSYNAGEIEGEDDFGAVAGTNEGTVSNCYYLEGTAEFGIGRGGGAPMMRTAEELMSAQMVSDLAAGHEQSLWVRGSVSEGGYNFPVLRAAAQD